MRPSFSFVGITIILLTIPLTIDSIRCVDCRSLGEESRCNNECDGDFCVLWYYREMSTDYKLQGCVTGMTAHIAMGCHMNKAGAILCLCNSNDLCNEEISPSIRLAEMKTHKCNSFTKATFITPKKTNNNYCESDFCYYTEQKFVGKKAKEEFVISASCGQMPQYGFDFLIGPLWPSPGFLSNACYQLEVQFGRTQLGCLCSTDYCNDKPSFSLIPKPSVRCHLAMGDVTDEDIRIRMKENREHLQYCLGEFCIIQQTHVENYGEYFIKGCLRASKSAMLVGGYRDVLGTKQWFCSSDFCNVDLQSAVDNELHFESIQYFERMRGVTSNRSNVTDTNITPRNTSNIGGRVIAQYAANLNVRRNVGHILCSYNVYSLLILLFTRFLQILI